MEERAGHISTPSIHVHGNRPPPSRYLRDRTLRACARSYSTQNRSLQPPRPPPLQIINLYTRGRPRSSAHASSRQPGLTCTRRLDCRLLMSTKSFEGRRRLSRAIHGPSPWDRRPGGERPSRAAHADGRATAAHVGVARVGDTTAAIGIGTGEAVAGTTVATCAGDLVAATTVAAAATTLAASVAVVGGCAPSAAGAATGAATDAADAGAAALAATVAAACDCERMVGGGAAASTGASCCTAAGCSAGAGGSSGGTGVVVGLRSAALMHSIRADAMETKRFSKAPERNFSRRSASCEREYKSA